MIKKFTIYAVDEQLGVIGVKIDERSIAEFLPLINSVECIIRTSSADEDHVEVNTLKADINTSESTVSCTLENFNSPCLTSTLYLRFNSDIDSNTLLLNTMPTEE